MTSYPDNFVLDESDHVSEEAPALGGSIISKQGQRQVDLEINPNSQSCVQTSQNIKQEEGENEVTEQAEKQKLELVQQEFLKRYHPQVVYSVFTLLFITNIMINVDHGSLPGCFNAIKQKLEVGNLGFGILGSIVFVGLIFGSMAATGLFSQGSWIKPTLILALVLNAISLYVFTLSNSFYLMVIVRGAIGFFQVFVCIYMPVWVDTFGSESQKSIWLTINMLASPLGVVLGYTLTYYMNLYHSWEWSFNIQAIAMIPCIGCVIVTPSQYLNIEKTIEFRNRCGQIVEQQISKKEWSLTKSQSENLEKIFTNQVAPEPELEARTSIKQLQGFSGGDQESFFEKLQSLRSNTIFLKLTVSLSGLFFVVTGIQYWLPDYMTNVLYADEATVGWYYSFLSFTAPISGVIMSGIITTKLGGYNSIKAQYLQCLMGVCAVISAMPIPFMTNFHAFAFFIWFLLFFGGFILPPMTGIMLNSVSEYQRTSANSLANLSYNLLGYAPAPIFYGMVSKISGGDPSNRWPMGCLLYSTIFTVYCFLSAMRQKLKNEDNKQAKFNATELSDELMDVNHSAAKSPEENN